jgi:hypothetical protein
VPCSIISTRRFGERNVSIFRGSYVDRIPQLYYRGNTVTEYLHRGTPLSLLGSFHGGVNYRCLLGICAVSTTSTRRFGERNVSIFRSSYVDRIPQLYYRGNTVTEYLYRGTPLSLLGSFHGGVNYRCLLGICAVSTTSTRRFGERTVSIFRGALKLEGRLRTPLAVCVLSP